MSLKPTDIWANTETNVTEPAQQQKDDGWECGAASPYTMNWILNSLSKCVTGNIHKWRADVAAAGGYVHPAIVIGSDNKLYTTVSGASDITSDPVGDGGVNWASYTSTKLPDRYIDVISDYTGVTTTSLSAGRAAGALGISDGTLNLLTTKDISGNWGPGDAAGGLPTGLVLPGTPIWVYQFMLIRADGTADWGYDTVLNAAQLLADPNVVLENFVDYRMVCPVLWTGTEIWGYTQHGDNHIRYHFPLADWTVAALPGVFTLVPISAPPIEGSIADLVLTLQDDQSGTTDLYAKIGFPYSGSGAMPTPDAIDNNWAVLDTSTWSTVTNYLIPVSSSSEIYVFFSQARNHDAYIKTNGFYFRR